MSERLEKIKKLIDEESSPEILRALILKTCEENERLSKLLSEIEAEKARQSQSQLNIEDEIKALRRELFGRGREKRPDGEGASRRKTPNEAMIFSQAAFPLPETSKSQKDLWKSILERKIPHSLLPEALKAESEARGLANASAEQWQEIPGAFDQLVTIQILERSYIKEVHQKKKYRLKDEFNPQREEKDVIITAPGPKLLLPGMNYSTEFVASVVADKYISHMPLDRQVKEMKSLGLDGVRTSTLSRLCALAAASLEDMAEAIKTEILAEAESIALHLDETPWKIQRKEEGDGYMWVISNRLGSYYLFKPTRSGKVLKEKLAGYTGRVLTDGYAGYNVLEELKIEQGFCWAHSRRKFLPFEKDDPGAKAILDDIDELFAIEREAKSFDELKLLRVERSQKVIERLKAKLLEDYPRSRPGSGKRKALDYLLERWAGFTRFLTDIRLPLSNNEAERTIRHAVMGRKNYYGSNNHSGAATAATLFTVIESCKKNEVDPRAFLLMSLERAARGEELETPLSYARRTRQPA